MRNSTSGGFDFSSPSDPSAKTAKQSCVIKDVSAKKTLGSVLGTSEQLKERENWTIMLLLARPQLTSSP